MGEIPKYVISFWFSNNLIITSLGSFIKIVNFVIVKPAGRTKRFISNVDLPHPDRLTYSQPSNIFR